MFHDGFSHANEHQEGEWQSSRKDREKLSFVSLHGGESLHQISRNHRSAQLDLSGADQNLPRLDLFDSKDDETSRDTASRGASTMASGESALAPAPESAIAPAPEASAASTSEASAVSTPEAPAASAPELAIATTLAPTTAPELNSGDTASPQINSPISSTASSAGGVTTQDTPTPTASNSASNQESTDTVTSATTELVVTTAPPSTSSNSTDSSPLLPASVNAASKSFDSDFAGQGLGQFINGQLVGGQTTLSGNAELEKYTPSNSVLETVNDPVTGKPITVADEFVTPNGDGTFSSGALTTTNSIGASDNGYYQVTMQLSSTADTWPAAWSSNGREIDIVEALSSGQSDGSYSEPSGSIHNGVIDWANSGSGGGGWTNVSSILASEPALANGQAETLQNSFHSYGVLVNGNNLTYYFDGKPVNSATDTLGSEGPAQWMINTAVGGSWSGDATANNGPYGPGNGTLIESVTAYSQTS